MLRVKIKYYYYIKKKESDKNKAKYIKKNLLVFSCTCL